MIRLTEKAVQEIMSIIASQGSSLEDTYVRAGIVGGGCTGCKNIFCLDENFDESRDILFEQDGLKIIVDNRSILYLENTVVDFKEELNRRGFVFNSPSLVKSTCICNSSY